MGLTSLARRAASLGVELIADPIVRLVALSRGITLLAAPAILYLVASRRPPAEQGFYFIFANVLALTSLFELGAGTMLVQFVGHNVNELTWHGSRLASRGESLGRLSALIQQAQAWYFAAGALLALVLLPGGIAFFRDEALQTATSYTLPWVVVVSSVCSYLLLIPLVCVLEGAGRIRDVQRMRVTQAITSALCVLFGVLVLDSLRAVALASVAQLFVVLAWLVRCFPRFVGQWIAALRSRPATELSSTKPSLILSQTKTGFAWLIGFAGPQCLAPLVFLRQGSADAGKLGLSLAAVSAPLTIAVSWLHARYPLYGRYAAARELARLKQLTIKATNQALIVCLTGEVFVLTAVTALQRLAPALGERLLSISGVAALAVASLGSLLYQSMAARLRAHRDEPLLAPLAISTITILACATLAAKINATATAYVYAVVTYVVLLPLSAARLARTEGRVGESGLSS